MKRIRMEVCPSPGASPWKVTIKGSCEYVALTQASALETALGHIYEGVALGKLFTLKIKRRDGTIREERTYPQSSDPKRSKG